MFHACERNGLGLFDGLQNRPETPAVVAAEVGCVRELLFYTAYSVGYIVSKPGLGKSSQRGELF